MERLVSIPQKDKVAYVSRKEDYDDLFQFLKRIR